MSIQTPPETTRGPSTVELIKPPSNGLLGTAPKEFAAPTEREVILCS
jgi:hypothetical protein